MPRTSEGHHYSAATSTHTDGLETDAVVPSSPSLSSSYDVIVIGAGFAGLIAARDLSNNKKNLKILLLEARDRIGGRTWTAQINGEDFEMGGTWIHWHQPHVYAEASRYGLHKVLKTSAGTAEVEEMLYKPKGEEVRRVDVTETDATLERVAAEFFAVDGLNARKLMPFPHEPLREPKQAWWKYDHLSVRERLDQMDVPQAEKDLLESHFNSLGSGPADRTGFTAALQWYAISGYSMQALYDLCGTYKFGSGGMTSFAKRVLEEYRGDVAMSTKVKAITQDEQGVVVACDGGRDIRARYVVCTIPLNCLSDVRFDPPLSSLRQEAVAAGHMNKGAKVHYFLEGVQKGWFATTADTVNSDLVFAFSDHNGTTNSKTSQTFCIGFGRNGALQDPGNHQEVIAAMQKFKPGSKVNGYAAHAWERDPFAKGTWWCASPGTTSKYLGELQKPHGRVLMAGADWADGWRGFVDGAIEQGARAALTVASALTQEKGSFAKL